MGNSLIQWRQSIGCFNNHIKSKEIKLLLYCVNRIKALWNYFGMFLPLMIMQVSPDLGFISMLLLKCGDIESNPGPTSFCHLNARSILSGVDLSKHIESQYSLLDEIYETLVYVNDFDIIAIGETWLSDNISTADLTLTGYQVPI